MHLPCKAYLDCLSFPSSFRKLLYLNFKDNFALSFPAIKDQHRATKKISACGLWLSSSIRGRPRQYILLLSFIPLSSIYSRNTSIFFNLSFFPYDSHRHFLSPSTKPTPTTPASITAHQKGDKKKKKHDVFIPLLEFIDNERYSRAESPSLIFAAVS